MKELVHRGVALDVCGSCGATWYDGSELARVVGHAVQWGPPASIALEGVPAPACPRCRAPLEERRVAKLAGLSAEVCRRCGGVLLDKEALPRLRRHADETKRAKARTRQAAEDAAATSAAWRSAVTDLATSRAARDADALPDTAPEGPVRWLFAMLGLPVEEHGGVGQATWVLWSLIAAIVGVSPSR
jgi:Zn-finger nucleic acid-binding protein